MTKLKIKKGATVQVITGNDKGKKGAVLEVNSGKMLVKVQGVKVQTHYDRNEGLLKKEGFIHYSNVKLLDKAPEKKSGKKSGKAKSA